MNESGDKNPTGERMVDSLNRQRVLNLLDVFYSGDVEGALARCSDDVEFNSNAPVDILPHIGPRHGKAELREMWRTVHTRYYDMRHEVRAIVVDDDKVAVDLRVFFRKSFNNRIVQFDLAVFCTLRDGRIVRIREIIDTFDLVQQVLEKDVAALLAAGKPADA
jgi:ketosteroid isomerase-like protein